MQETDQTPLPKLFSFKTWWAEISPLLFGGLLIGCFFTGLASVFYWIDSQKAKAWEQTTSKENSFVTKQQKWAETNNHQVKILLTHPNSAVCEGCVNKERISVKIINKYPLPGETWKIGVTKKGNFFFAD